MTLTADKYEERLESEHRGTDILPEPAEWLQTLAATRMPTEISCSPPRYRAAAEFIGVVISFSVTACVQSTRGLSLLCGNPDFKVRDAMTIITRVLGLCRSRTIFMNANVDMSAVSCKKRMSRNKCKIRETTVRTRKAYSPSIDERRRQMDDPTSFLVFSVLGPDEQEYARMLKEDIVQSPTGI